MLTTEQRLYTAEELYALPDGERYELVQGRLIPMAPAGVDHGGTIDDLHFALSVYVRQHRLGKLYAAETGFNLRQPDETEDTVLAPDIAFIQTSRVPAPGGRAYPLLAPDLVVEVVSEPDETAKEVADKARLWLSRGARLVWTVWRRRQAIDVWTPGADAPRRRRPGDELEGEDVIPGFRLPVEAAFP